MLAETRLLTEWLAATYPTAHWWQQLGVGRDPAMVGVNIADAGELKLARNLNRRVDAVVVTDTELLVIEATMFRATDKIGRLQEYMLLLPATPELQPYLGMPRVGVLLTGQDDAVAAHLCSLHSFRYVFYEPSWIDDFYAAYPDRRRRAPHAGMVQALAGQASQ